MTRYPIFRIFYSATFTVLFIALLCLLLIPPGDVIRQAQSRGRWYDVFSVAGAYLLTLVVVIVFYASRLYSNRAALAAIPKSWIPIEKTDLRPAVWRMISGGLARSRNVAWGARPRDLRGARNGDAVINGHGGQLDDSRQHQTPAGRKSDARRRSASKDTVAGIIDPQKAARSWGHIAHPGWSSPSTLDFPNLHYNTVVSELAHLLEAKAVSLAPPNPTYAAPDKRSLAPVSNDGPAPDEVAPPDPRALELLQRPASSGMREYVMQLAQLGVITSPSSIIARFLTQYERARFSDEGLPEEAFRALMSLFSEIIRGMTGLNEDALAQLSGDYENRTSLRSHSSASTESLGERTPTERSPSRASSIQADTRVDQTKHQKSSTPCIPSSSSSTRSTHHHSPTSRRNTPWATAPQTPHVPFPHSSSSSLAESIASHQSGIPPDGLASQGLRRQGSLSTSSMASGRSSGRASAAPSASQASSSSAAYASSVIVRRSHVEELTDT